MTHFQKLVFSSLARNNCSKPLHFMNRRFTVSVACAGSVNTREGRGSRGAAREPRQVLGLVRVILLEAAKYMHERSAASAREHSASTYECDSGPGVCRGGRPPHVQRSACMTQTHTCHHINHAHMCCLDRGAAPKLVAGGCLAADAELCALVRRLLLVAAELSAASHPSPRFGMDAHLNPEYRRCSKANQSTVE